MNIVIPFNSRYLEDRYEIKDDFLKLLLGDALSSVIDRYSADERVESIELVSDIDVSYVGETNNKTTCTQVDIGNLQEANEVTKRVIEVRTVQSDIVVQTNLLYPFVSVNSLYRAFLNVKENRVSSAIGSVINRSSETDMTTVAVNDLGIFSVYNASRFLDLNRRTTPPVELIALKASEIISLRSQRDYGLFELIVNSGYEL